MMGACQNGNTDAGELHALAAFDIVAFSVRPTETDITVASGATFRAEGWVYPERLPQAGSRRARSDGSTGDRAEVIFQTDLANTRYLGDRGVAANNSGFEETEAA